MLYEVRIYTAAPGKMPALLKRFETVTVGIWQRHGIVPTGFFTTLVGSSNAELTYILQWQSLADRERRWSAFMADPEWIAKRAESEKDGPLLTTVSNQILQPTSFSALK